MIKVGKGDYAGLIAEIKIYHGRRFDDEAERAMITVLSRAGWDMALAVISDICKTPTIQRNVLGLLQQAIGERQRSMITTRDYSGHRHPAMELPEERRVICPRCKGPSRLSFAHTGVPGRIWIFWDCQADGRGCTYGKMGSTYGRDEADRIILRQRLYEDNKQLTMRRYWDD